MGGGVVGDQGEGIVSHLTTFLNLNIYSNFSFHVKGFGYFL